MISGGYHVLRRIEIGFILLSFLVMTQCSGGGTEVGNPTLDTFQNNSALEDYLKDQYARSVLPENMYALEKDQSDDAVDVNGDTSGNMSDESGGDSNRDASYSDTNNQEAGVIESDKVKTDGTYLYIAGDRQVSLVDVQDPEKMQNLKTIAIDGTIKALDLYNTILIVIYTPNNFEGYTNLSISLTEPLKIGMPYWIPVKAQTGVHFYDVSDPADPQLLKETLIDGEFLSTRRIDNRFHLVQRFFPELPALEYAYDGTESDWAKVIENNKKLLTEKALDDLVPIYHSTDYDDSVADSRDKSSTKQLISPENFYRPKESGGTSTIIITSFDLRTSDLAFKSIGIIADAEIVYASASALYVTATEWNYQKTYAGNTSTPIQTVIHKFDLTGADVKSKGSGRVNGRVLNQFSLGEYNQTLNIATTTDNSLTTRSQSATNNHVYCLQEQDSDLVIVGQINNIAPGEKLYAARFIGNKGFLVTFVKVDPLFTLDLSNPQKPTIAGELKVPGYSDYIHPINETMLLTIGKDTKVEDETTYYQGVQLSIFDIQNFSEPNLINKELIGDRGTDSEALNNHKAFTYWSADNLLAIPIDLCRHDFSPEHYYERGTYVSSGLYIYRLTGNSGFQFLGSITTAIASEGTNYHGKEWTRGIFIGPYTFAIQANEVYSALTEDIENTVSKLPLAKENSEGKKASKPISPESSASFEGE